MTALLAATVKLLESDGQLAAAIPMYAIVGERRSPLSRLSAAVDNSAQVGDYCFTTMSHAST